MLCGSDIQGSPPGSKRRSRRCMRFTEHVPPNPVLRTPSCTHKAVNQPAPDSCISSFRSIRGYRPSDFFTRGTTLGGNTRPCPVTSSYECVHPGEGYLSWRPSNCADVPRITACSKYCSPVKSEKYASPQSSDEEEVVEYREAPHPVKCECKTQVETKPVTSNAFTMTDKISRDQGTMAKMEVSHREVDATLVMRDVATDTVDPFEDFLADAASEDYRFSRTTLRSRSGSKRNITFNPDTEIAF